MFLRVRSRKGDLMMVQAVEHPCYRNLLRKGSLTVDMQLNVLNLSGKLLDGSRRLPYVQALML